MATILGNSQEALDNYNAKMQLQAVNAELAQMYQLNQRLTENLNAALEEFKRLHGLHSGAIVKLKELGEDTTGLEYIINQPKPVDAFNFVVPSEF